MHLKINFSINGIYLSLDCSCLIHVLRFCQSCLCDTFLRLNYVCPDVLKEYITIYGCTVTRWPVLINDGQCVEMCHNLKL